MNFPENLKYTKDHEWILDNGDGTALVGITDFAQGELGDIVYVEVDTVDEDVDKDDIFGTVEAVKTTSDLYMPVSGTVLEFNSVLDESEGDEPGTINSDPYGDGWIVKIKLEDPSQLDELLSAADYGDLVG